MNPIVKVFWDKLNVPMIRFSDYISFYGDACWLFQYTVAPMALTLVHDACYSQRPDMSRMEITRFSLEKRLLEIS